MKDAYSFDKDERGLDESYQKMFSAYKDIFKECGLDVIITEADSGVMGGNVSHEFMVAADIGEDMVKGQRTIEVGHIFKLGTKYSKVQEALFLDQEGKRQPAVMGCYGIGVSRVLSSIIEVNSDEKGMVLPKTVAPYQAIAVVLDKNLLKDALKLGESLEKQGIDILIDDRDLSSGVKFNDALLLGMPYILVMGKNFKQSKNIDVEVRKTGKKHQLNSAKLIKFLKDEYK